MKIRETIHHGNYYNVRESDGDIVGPTLLGLLEPDEIGPTLRQLLLGSPYNFHSYEHNVERCISELRTTGRGEIGWAVYEIIQEEDA